LRKIPPTTIITENSKTVRKYSWRDSARPCVCVYIYIYFLSSVRHPSGPPRSRTRYILFLRQPAGVRMKSSNTNVVFVTARTFLSRDSCPTFVPPPLYFVRQIRICYTRARPTVFYRYVKEYISRVPVKDAYDNSRSVRSLSHL